MFHLEMSKLQKMFAENGYPSSIFFHCVSSFLESKIYSNFKEAREKPNFGNLLKVPFIGRESVLFAKRVVKVFKEVDIDITIMYSSTKLGRFFPLKCPTPLALRSGVVYQFKSLCDADWSYIGKTKRHLSTRVKEHLSGRSAEWRIMSHVAQLVLRVMA